MAEDWETEYKRVQAELKKQQETPRLPSGPAARAFPFPVIDVSVEANELIQDHEQAVMILAAAKDETAALDAYGLLCHRRKTLYEYISRLEAQLGIERTKHWRFD